jgi:hypothetical protein
LVEQDGTRTGGALVQGEYQGQSVPPQVQDFTRRNSPRNQKNFAHGGEMMQRRAVLPRITQMARIREEAISI